MNREKQLTMPLLLPFLHSRITSYNVCYTKLLRIVSGIRIFVGIVFMVSGFLKAVDPYGTAIKLTEYFTAFGMDFLEPVTLFLSVVLICCEFLCGFFLTMGLWYKKIVIWIITALVGFFTILTLFIALTNPVSDCGCFGDAIKLTNWQTFFKNIA